MSTNPSDPPRPTVGRHQRPCPAISGGVISPAECGVRRVSQLACPADCVFNPFGRVGYDLWLKVDAEWTRKAADYVLQHLGAAEVRNRLRRFTIAVADQEAATEFALFNTVYLSLFVLPTAAGRPLAAEWEVEGWAGLNNDERIMMEHRRRMRPTVVEIQQVLDAQSVRCVDVFAADPQPFVVFDRGIAARGVRFSRIFTWLAHYPHFSRVGGNAIEIPARIWTAWRDEVQARFRQAAASRADLPLGEFMAENVVECCHLATALARAYQRKVFDQLDLNHCVVKYQLTGPPEAVEQALLARSEFERGSAPDGQFAPPQAFFCWLAKGESAAMNKPDPAARELGVQTSVDGVELVANVRLYAEHLLIETFSARKKDFARGVVESLLAGHAVFAEEAVENLTQAIRERAAREAAVSRVAETAYSVTTSPVPPPAAAHPNPVSPPPVAVLEELAARLRHRYMEFLDEPVPTLDGQTPRAAAADPALRGQLLELMKVHLNELDRRNRENRTTVSLDWLLEELGLPELKATAG